MQPVDLALIIALDCSASVTFDERYTWRETGVTRRAVRYFPAAAGR